LAYTDLGKFDDAWCCVGETMTLVETTKERWFEAEADRIAGEIAQRAPGPGAAKAFEFSRSTIAARRKQGLSDVLIALQPSPSLAPDAERNRCARVRRDA